MKDFFLVDMKRIQKIYSNMVDEKSKTLFMKRLCYNITGDFNHILNIEKTTELIIKLKKFEQQGRKLIIFGAGLMGRHLVKYYLTNIKLECFADNNVKEDVLGLRVIDINELKRKYLDAVIIISPWKPNADIYNQLIGLGFDKNNIINFGRELEKDFARQYFDLIPDSEKKESFVDCGCLDGYTSKKFVEWCKGEYSNIWAFEPDPVNYEMSKKSLTLPNCTLYNMGVFDSETTVSFKAGLEGSSTISDKGETKIKTVRLDDVLKDKEVTFIKMDIEGAELKALIGAENIIRTQKPKLAICVYHKSEDIISIPNLILEYNPDYRFKLEHYSLANLEYILYAF